MRSFRVVCAAAALLLAAGAVSANAAGDLSRQQPIEVTVDLGKPGQHVFEPQVRTIFGLIDQTLKRCGGGLTNLVTMTVFINDPRHGDRFVELRKGFFPDGNYPASALITVSHFARPGMLIEIQGVAVIGG